jgi:iron-sulfur cluster assembly accessory protein
MSSLLFTLTPAAIAFYQKKLTNETFLKFSTKSGCSGKKIEIEFVNTEKIINCEVLEQDEIKVFYEKKDTEFLKDLEIDYVKNIVGGTIEFNNPKAKNRCGCGSSWS